MSDSTPLYSPPSYSNTVSQNNSLRIYNDEQIARHNHPPPYLVRQEVNPVRQEVKASSCCCCLAVFNCIIIIALVAIIIWLSIKINKQN